MGKSSRTEPYGRCHLGRWLTYWGTAPLKSPNFTMSRKIPQGFSGGRGRRARSCFATPLAVPEKIFGLPLFLDFFDRCANPCSLYPPPAALAGVARHAPRASGSSLFRETKKSPRKAETFLFGRADAVKSELKSEFSISLRLTVSDPSL